MKAWLIVLLGLPLSLSAEALSLCVEDADYPPLLLSQDVDGRSGLLPDISRAAAIAQGQDIELLRHPWKRCIKMLRKNQVDAIAAVLWSAERDAWGAFPKTGQQTPAAPDPELRLWREEYRVFVPLAGKLRYDGQQFSGIQTGLGAPPGYVVWQRLKEAGVLNESVRSVKVGLQLVALNRLDGYVSERSIGLNLLRVHGLADKVKLLPQTYYTDDSYLVFSQQFQRQNPQLVQAIWQSLPAIRERQLGKLLAE